MFNFTGDQALVQQQINAAGAVIVVEDSNAQLKGVVNRKSDDLAKEFAQEIGDMEGSGVLAMISFGHLADPHLSAGCYITYGGKRACVRKIKRREYGGVLVRLRCLVEENAA